ncbi:MAG TPA: hypothetical protein VGD67_21335, partial [Pseudonocardiaceae bacterium]
MSDVDFLKPVPLGRRRWSLREDVLVEADDDALVVVTRWGEYRVDDPGPLVRESLRRMLLGPVSLANVLPGGGPAHGAGGVPARSGPGPA